MSLLYDNKCKCETIHKHYMYTLLPTERLAWGFWCGDTAKTTKGCDIGHAKMPHTENM